MELDALQPMLIGRFHPPKWIQTVIRVLNRFFYSPIYVIFIALLATFANIRSAELEVYTVYTVIVVIMCLLGRDFLPIVPMTVCSYIIPSFGNNPGINEISIFFSGYGAEHITTLAVIIVAFLLLRLLIDKKIGIMGIFRNKYRLLIGILLLGISYMISGFDMENYSELASKNIFFAFLQFASLIVPYTLLVCGVRWEHAPRSYLAWVGTAVGFVLLAELVHIYLTQNIIVDGIILRDFICTGWGIHNNIGGMLTMMLPFPFYLACKHRFGWLGILGATAIMVGIIMTNSRSSMLVGGILYVLCVILTIVFTKHKIAVGCSIGAILTIGIYFISQNIDQLSQLFDFLINHGWNPGGREEIYEQGIQQFHAYPIFGGSFFPTDYAPFDYAELETFSSFFPPRWHNTIIQLLACCGITGLITYLFHCIQVFYTLIHRISLLKTFIGFSVMALLLTSMLDCHFFNIGPVLFYSMALAFGEKADAECVRGKYEKTINSQNLRLSRRLD